MKSPIFKYGIYAGIVLSFYVIVVALTMSSDDNMTVMEVSGNAIMLAVFSIFIYVAAKRIRDDERGGYISFGSIFGKGILITLLASSLYSLTWIIFTAISDIDFGKIMMEMTAIELQKEGASDDEISKALKEFEDFMPYYNMPVIKFLITIIEPFFPGLIASLIMAFVLRKRAPVA